MRIARLHRLLALFLVLCMLCSASLPVYAEALPMPSDESTASTETPAVDTENFSTTETATSTETNTDNSDVSEPVSESGLSEAAQAFVDAVAALDRDAIVSASNAWGLASKAWQADKSNKELENALNEAISAQEQVCAPLTTADDLYNALSEDDRNNETVAAAYARFEEIWTAMINAMENPVDNSDTSDEPTELTDIVDVMYPGLPVAPTGYYLDSNGLPVVTGETMISIEGWGTEDYSAYDADSETQVALDADLLEAASATASFPRMDGESYAIVPISIQVLYPANGSSAEISLPENVTLLGYSFTSDNLIEATEDERSTMLHYDFSEISASVAGIYVMANSNFEATLTYTDDSQTLTKKLSVTIDDSAPQSGILQDRFSQESATSTYALNATPRAGLQVTQCINTSIGWMNYLGGMPVLCADHGKWAWGPGATYANKYPPVASYSAAGSVWVDASAFGKGWEADQATIWSVGFNNGTPAGARSSTYSLEGATGDTSYYDRLSWQASAYPDSIAASIVDDLNKAVPYLGPGESQTVYLGTLYTPSNSAWQRFVYLDYTPVVLGGDTEIPGLTPEGQPIEIPWQASYERTATLDLEYTVQIDKSANITHEKLDDAIFTITANQTGGSISGGTWSIDEPQKVVTTVDGAASATWVVHYEVTKSASQSGSVTANSEQDAITNGQAQANQQQAAAQAACEAQVNGEIDAALAAAKEQLSQLTFSYEETTVPHGFDPTESSSGSVSVPSNGSSTAVVANQPWQANITWEKRDALTGGRITEDAEYAFYEWNVDANKYEISSNYRVTRLENGLYTVTVTNPVYTDWTEGYVYYTQDNLGKFRIEEVTAPAGYTDAALQGTDWVEHWSQEFEITDSDQTYSYTGDDADYNRPQGNKVIIKKIEAHTGEIIVDDAVFTLYQWNQERGLYEKSKDYTFVRDAEGLYTITCLHDDWSQYEEGNLYYEDTLCDVREDTVNSDGTTTEHPQYYTDYEPADFSIDERAVTNDGQFVVVESRSPYGYYGDWTGSRETPNFEVEDAGKHAYYIRLTDDGSTITLTDSEYNAHVLTENKGGTLIDLGDEIVSLDVFRPAVEEYAEDNLFRNNPWYSTVVWEKRDALTGGLVDASAEYEIQEWDPDAGEYKKSTHYQVVRRDDGKYTVNLIGDAFFPGWEGMGASKSTWLVDTSDQSVLMVAPPGAGKSTSLYIPTITYNARVNLHTQDAQGIGQGASMVLVSVKDDLYTITGGELKKCGYRVLKLDLRNVFCSCHFNLLYRVNIEIDAWRKENDAKQKAVHYATAERYAKVIASAIIGNTGSVNSGDSSEYFNETARGLITGLVLLVSQYGQDGERHIVSVFNLIVELAGADNPEKGNTVQKSRLAAMLEGVTDRRIKGYISTTTSADIRTTLNIVSSALSKLLKFVDAELEQLICTHDNDLDAERFIERPTAIFLIAPDENETRHFLASLFVRFLTDDLIALAERQGGHCPRPFYYFLDEFGNFPAIPGVTSLFSAIRSRGGRILVAVQSYSQFLLKYDKNVTEIIKDNCQILLNTFVSPSAQDTATSISKMLGDETILTGSSSRSDGKTSNSHQLMGRPLMSPAQMVRIQRDTWIVEKAGYAPMKTHLEGYWKYLSLAPQEQDTTGENDYMEIKLLSTDSLRRALGSAPARPHTPPEATRGPRRKLGASRREAAALYPGKFNP